MTEYAARVIHAETDIVLEDETFERFVELGGQTTSPSRPIREAAKRLDDEGF